MLEGEVAEAKKKIVYEGDVYSLLEIEDGKATIKKEGGKAFVVSESEISEADEVLIEQYLGEDKEADQKDLIEAPPAFSPDVDLQEKVKYEVKHKEPIYEFDLNELMSQ